MTAPTPTAKPIAPACCEHCSQRYFGKDARLELAIHVERQHPTNDLTWTGR